MKSDMKNEFEEYVSKLTSSICKDIFLEEFKDLCNKMNLNIVIYDNLSEDISENIETNEKLFGEISQVKDTLDKELVELQNNTHLVVQNMIDENKQLKGYTGNLFNELKEQHFNESKNYRIELDNCLENKKVQIREMIESQVVNIENVLEGIITRDDIQKFIEEIRENAKQSKELANFVNSAYKDKIGKSVIEILQQTDRAQEEVHEKLSKHVDDVLKQLEVVTLKDQVAINKYVVDFQESVNKQVVELKDYFLKCMHTDNQNREIFLKRQEELINQKCPTDEKLEQLEKRIFEFEGVLEKIKCDNEHTNKQLDSRFQEYICEQKELDRKRYQEHELIEKRAESLAWKMYMTVTNTLLVCVLGLLIFLQKPWEKFGVKITVIVTAICFEIILLFIILKKVIAKAIIKRKRDKDAK